MATKAVNVTLDLNAPKVHSVRFTATGVMPALRDIYLANKAWEDLGKPTRITVRIEREG